MYDNLIALRKSLGLDQKEFAESAVQIVIQCQHICGRAFAGHLQGIPKKAKKPPSGGIFYYFLAFLHAFSRIIASILCATAIKSAC